MGNRAPAILMAVGATIMAGTVIVEMIQAGQWVMVFLLFGGSTFAGGMFWWFGRDF